MRVWRVAHETARVLGFPAGPYAYGASLGEATTERVNPMRWEHFDERHPCPNFDGTLRTIHPEERCGFDSREALDDWFDGWTATLGECGFRVYTYDVPDWAVRVGAHGQALFLADEAVEAATEAFA